MKCQLKIWNAHPYQSSVQPWWNLKHLAFERPHSEDKIVSHASQGSRLQNRVCFEWLQRTRSYTGFPSSEHWGLWRVCLFSQCICLHYGCYFYLANCAGTRRPLESLEVGGNLCLVPSDSGQSSYPHCFFSFPSPSTIFHPISHIPTAWL